MHVHDQSRRPRPQLEESIEANRCVISIIQLFFPQVLLGHFCDLDRSTNSHD